MNQSYKLSIIEKLIEFLGLLYFVTGFLINYSWSCKTLDLISNNDDILLFWEPIAGIGGLLNLTIVLLIVYFIQYGRNNPRNYNFSEINTIFYALSIPTFVVTFVYMILGITIDGYNITENGALSLFLSITELIFLFSSLFFIFYLNIIFHNYGNIFEFLLKKSIVFITIIGLLNYLFFHLIAIQIHTFVDIASNSSNYIPFYNHNLSNYRSFPFDFPSIRNYMQPFVVLFCFICVVQLIIQRKTIISIDISHELVNPISSVASTSETHPKKSYSKFKVPPLSLLFGILFIALTLLVLLIVNSLIYSQPFAKFGQFIFTIYPIPIYLFSIFLNFIQINEMQKWDKLKKNVNYFDKILLYIGTVGQCIVALGQIKYFYEHSNTTLSWIVRLEYTILIVQIIVQFVSIGIILDRKAISPEIQTWQEALCPPVGMLSINIAFLIFSIYVVKIDETKINNKIELFRNLFGLGFVSLGETFAILNRLHSSLIFGKLIISKYD